MSNRETVLVTGHQSEEKQNRIRAAAGERARVEFVSSLEDARDLLPEATAIAGGAPQGTLASAPNVRWVHSWAAGPDADLTDEVLHSDVILTSSVGNGAIPLAEHSMMLMLMLNREAMRWIEAQRNKRWDRFTHAELNGLTLGIFGVGHAGTDLAAKAKAFHMRVLGCRRRPEIAVPNVDEMFSLDRLHEFLAQSDVVVVTAPRTPLTAGVFNDAAFAAMKDTAHFICISRGGIADDDALLRALQDGTIAGAGIDAHGIEPLPEDSPFWGAPNTIVTPHNGATTAATASRGFEIFIGNVERFVQGEDLSNVVDKVAGY